MQGTNPNDYGNTGGMSNFASRTGDKVKKALKFLDYFVQHGGGTQ